MAWMRLGCPAVFLLLALGCAPQTSTSLSPRKVNAVATVGMVADTVRQVGGDRVGLTALMGSGVDPHMYKASEGDIVRLAEADVVFYSGLHLEGKMGRILQKMERVGKRAVAVTDGVDRSRLHKVSDSEGHYDPHVWFDVSMWTQTIQPVVDALSGLDPAYSESYKTNGASYRERLLELHEYCKGQLATIPKPRRVLVTAHDAFGYFGRAYDIEVIGLQGMSTSSEYGLKDIRRLVALIADRGVKAVFVESSVPKRSIEAVVAGCRARGHEVKIGGELFSDAMGEAGTPAGTYIGMVRHNVDLIVAALQ